MNYSIIRRILGIVIKVLGALMMLPVICGAVYKERECLVYLAFAVAYIAIGNYLASRKVHSQVFYAREGFAVVGLSWIILSILGAFPFIVTGDIPDVTNAIFETASGFTTTGSSILSDVEALSHTSLFWRSFTHWIGGMGVIVFILAILPMTGGSNMNLMRAESPGPSVGKLVPKIKETAKILYLIYLTFTVSEIILLLIARMPLFDALCIAFGSAGTGGFGVRNDSCASYTPLMQGIITVFILMFGVNFNAYFYLLGKNKKEVLNMSELKGYFGVVFFCIVTITANIHSMFPSIFEAFRHAAFQVASIITTTGFATQDFDRWPQYSRCLLVLIMFIGACAGSTGGGMKVSRIMIMVKTVKRELHKYLHPRSVTNVTMDGAPLDKGTLHSVSVYLSTYMLLFCISVVAVAAAENIDLESVFTSVACTFNNIGPGLNRVGPTCNFSEFSVFSKYVLIFDMLAGRLELYPMLILLMPSLWKKA